MISLISGTTRAQSRTLQVTQYYANLLEIAGVAHNVIDLSEYAEGLQAGLQYEKNPLPESLSSVAGIMNQKPKIVIITPEYNSSIPGTLKLFIDQMPYPATWKNKKIGLIGLGSGVQGAVLAMSHLTDIFHYMGAEVMGFKPKLNFISQHLKDGEITNALFVQMLNEHVQKMIQF